MCCLPNLELREPAVSLQSALALGYQHTEALLILLKEVLCLILYCACLILSSDSQAFYSE